MSTNNFTVSSKNISWLDRLFAGTGRNNKTEQGNAMWLKELQSNLKLRVKRFSAAMYNMRQICILNVHHSSRPPYVKVWTFKQLRYGHFNYISITISIHLTLTQIFYLKKGLTYRWQWLLLLKSENNNFKTGPHLFYYNGIFTIFLKYIYITPQSLCLWCCCCSAACPVEHGCTSSFVLPCVSRQSQLMAASTCGNGWKTNYLCFWISRTVQQQTVLRRKEILSWWFISTQTQKCSSVCLSVKCSSTAESWLLNRENKRIVQLVL